MENENNKKDAEKFAEKIQEQKKKFQEISNEELYKTFVEKYINIELKYPENLEDRINSNIPDVKRWINYLISQLISELDTDLHYIFLGKSVDAIVKTHIERCKFLKHVCGLNY